MKSPKRWLVSIAVLVVLGCLVWAAEEAKTPKSPLSAATAEAPVWHMDFEKARSSAVEQDRPILALFDGSDWCPWCKKLRGEVFVTPDFASYAANRLVLFEADFPIHKTLPESEVKQNNALVEEYSVEGFPTVLILDKEGEVLARTGYRPGGGTAYVEHLKTLLAKASPPSEPAPEATEASETAGPDAATPEPTPETATLEAD
ncbi:thioredoxin family protein [Candidatus Sumerlaeota bacterium]|nr:thioredoxin family protein [Candidatus Sumerlaeota bacterium]